MRVEFGNQPLPSFEAFHISNAYERALFGAFGSGKTYALIDEAIAWMLEQPGIRGCIARKTVPELRDTTEPIFMERCPSELIQASEIRRSGGHLERVVFPNGSTVLFRSLDDWNKHRSLNIGFLAIDEANEVDEETYLGMLSRVRQRDITAEARKRGYSSEVTRRGVWLATNPAGHDWLFRRFVDKKKRKDGTAFFQSTSLDNPYLPMEYVEGLLAYPEQWVRRYVLCDFDDFAGQIYEDWNWETHVIDPSPYPPGAVFWMGMDPGTRSPTAGLWVYVDEAKRQLTGVAEYQEQGLAAPKHAVAWRTIEARHQMNVTWRVSDPNAITTRDRGSNMQLQDQYRRLGFPFRLGPSQHKHRIPMLGQLISTGRFKVTKDCPQTYEAVRDYRWEDLTAAMRQKGVDAPEKPHKANDHLVDCAQYLSSRWVSPMKIARPSRDQTFSQEVSRIIKRNIRDKRIPQPHHDFGVML